MAGARLALAWRFRIGSGELGELGVTLAVKFFLWPLLVWFVATRRVANAVVAAAAALGLLLASWAVIGFDGLRGYPGLLADSSGVGDDAYTGHDLAARPWRACTDWRTLSGWRWAFAAGGAHRARQARRRAIGFHRGSRSRTGTDAARLASLLRAARCRRRDRPAHPRLVWFIPLTMVVARAAAIRLPLQTSVALAALV